MQIGLDHLAASLARNDLLVPYLEAAMASEEWPRLPGTLDLHERPRSGYAYFHPSAHPLMSDRELYYRFHPDFKHLIVEEKPSRRQRFTFDVGTVVGALIQHFLVQVGLATEDDLEVQMLDHEHHVSGRGDAVVTHPREGRLLCEIKALACSTPILTTAGWSTMGELRDGDEVYGPDGQPTKVLQAHPIRLGRPCYEVRFRDGQSIVADGDHLWEVYDACVKRTLVVTTAELAGKSARYSHGFRYSVPVTEPLQMPDADLPVDPWLLGMWLGDGDTRQTCITSGEDDLDYLTSRLTERGFDFTVHRSARAPRVYVKGVRSAFRSLGLMGGHGPSSQQWGRKFIPEEYMLASERQRRDLLAGILDSDGTAAGHQVAICGKNKELMSQVLQLARSLGYRCTERDSRATLNGHYAGEVRWVKFSLGHELSPFQMPRKTERFDAYGLSQKHLRRNAIVSVSEVSTVPTRCITVAHESELYSVGEGFVVTHNTQNSRSFALQRTIKPSWKAQLQLTMAGLGLTKGVLLVCELGYPYDMKEFYEGLDPEYVGQLHAKFDRVRAAIAANTPPPHCCEQVSRTAIKRCGARGICFPGKP